MLLVCIWKYLDFFLEFYKVIIINVYDLFYIGLYIICNFFYIIVDKVLLN